jgi:hypothetical protein
VGWTSGSTRLERARPFSLRHTPTPPPPGKRPVAAGVRTAASAGDGATGAHVGVVAATLGFNAPPNKSAHCASAHRRRWTLSQIYLEPSPTSPTTIPEHPSRDGAPGSVPRLRPPVPRSRSRFSAAVISGAGPLLLRLPGVCSAGQRNRENPRLLAHNGSGGAAARSG